MAAGGGRMSVVSIGIVLMVVVSVIQSIATALFKLGSSGVVFTRPWTLFSDKYMRLGMVIYLPCFYLNVVAYEYGTLSELYPFQVLSQVWTLAIAISFFQEHMSLRRMLGVVSIFLGCLLITLDAAG
jgi:drug/metabolite transporter (DMT)-like permease